MPLTHNQQPFGSKTPSATVSDRRLLLLITLPRPDDPDGRPLVSITYDFHRLPRASQVLETNLLLPYLALCSQSDLQGAESLVEGPIWQPQATHIRPIGPCPTTNSRNYSKRPGSSCRAKQPRSFTRLSLVPSRLHGRRPHAAFGEGLKSYGIAQPGRRSEGVSLGLPRAHPLVSSSAWRHFWRRQYLGPFRLSSLVVPISPSRPNQSTRRDWADISPR